MTEIFVDMSFKRALIWSDLHIGREGALEALERLVRYQIDHAHQEGDVILCLGDITDNGAPSEYGEARALLMRASAPVLALPGNHDAGRLGIDYDARARGYFDSVLNDALVAELLSYGGEVSGAPLDKPEAWPILVRPREGAPIILLDSTQGQDGELLPNLARGELGAAQILRLGKLLEQLERPALVCLHHHPYWSDFAHALEDERALSATLRRYSRKILGVVFGHKHQRGARVDRGGWLALGCGRATEAKGERLEFEALELGDLRLHERGALSIISVE